MRLVCLICTDDIKTDCSTPRCGHIFHSDCLKHWLQLNKSCPQCRAKCSKQGDVIKLFLNTPGDDGNCTFDLPNTESNDDNLDRLRSRLFDSEQKLSERDSELFLLKEEFRLHSDSFHSLKGSHVKLEKKYAEERRAVSQLNKELKSVYSQFDKAKEDFTECSTRCRTLENSARVYKLIQSALDSGKSEIEFLVASYGDGPDAVRSIAQSFYHLKKNFDELKVMNDSLRAEKEKCLSEKNDLELIYTGKVQKLSKAHTKIAILSKEISEMQQKLNPQKTIVDTPETDQPSSVLSPTENQDAIKHYSKAKRIKVSYECNLLPSSPEHTPKHVVLQDEQLLPHKDRTNIAISRSALPLDLRPNYKKFSLIKHTLSDTAGKTKPTQRTKHTIRL